MINFFENNIDALQDSHEKILREKDEEFYKIYQENEEANNKLKSAEKTQQDLLHEMKKMEEHFEKESRV